MIPGTFYVFPGDFARELFNSENILHLPERSVDMCTLQESQCDIGRIGMYHILVTKVIH